MGTPDFAVPSLKAVAQSGHDLVGVVTRPDKPRGRGQVLQPTDVGAAVQSLNLKVPVFQPESLKDPAFHAQVQALQPDVFAVVAFLILPQSLLAVPRWGSVNVHPSLLPKYRGAAPIQWAIIRGETETGVTIFRLSPRVDAGDILIQERVAIGPEETAGQLYERLKFLGADLLVCALDGVAGGTLTPLPQSDAGATRAPKLEKDHGRINWAAEAQTICNLVRGTNPFPGAFAFFRGNPLKIHRVQIATGSGAPGSVLAADARAGLVVAAGKGALSLLEVQPSGKGRMRGADFVNGYRVVPGELLIATDS